MKIFRYIYLLLIGLALSQVAGAQTILTGVVKDKATGAPLVGANVYINNSANRTMAGFIVDRNGEYRLTVPQNAGDLRVVFSFVGYKPQEVAYTGQPTINVSLEREVSRIESIRVTAREINENQLGVPKSESTAATQTLTLENLETSPVTNIVEALQGQLANVDILTGAEPGANSTIRIRGTNSLNANQEPLIVVDGVPFPVELDDSFDFATANSEDYGQLLNMSPTDLESIEVLKDATATALWGSRGSNGVLVITTRKGTKGRITVSFNTKWEFRKEASTIPLLNGPEYVSLMQDALWNTINDTGSGRLEELINTKEISYDPNWVYFDEYSQNTDWVDEVTQTGYSTDNTLQVSGGGEKTTYRLSIGYLNETGTTIGTAFERFTTKFTMMYKFSDKLRIEASYSLTKGNRDSNYHGNERGIGISKMPNMSPYVMLDNTTRSGQYFTPLSNFQGSYETSEEKIEKRKNYNPVASVHEALNESSSLSNQVNFNLIYNILPELEWRSIVGVTISGNKSRSYLPQVVSGVTWTDEAYNRSSDGYSDQFYLYTENRLLYNKTWNDIHRLIASAIWRTSEQDKFSYNSEVSGNASSSMIDPVSGGIIRKAGSGTSKSRSVAGILNAHYTLMDKYSLNAGYNIEASSAMGKSNRWKAYPTLGFAWKVQEENFMESFRGFWDEAKLRASWGLSGNAPEGTSVYYGAFKALSAGYMGMSAYEPQRIQLDHLKYEMTRKSNLGVDLSFFDYNLTATFEVYENKSKDLLQKNVNIPTSTGYSKVGYINSGKMRNRGWEFYTNYKILNKRDLTLTFGFNISQNQNKILELPSTSNEESFEFKNGNYAIKNVVGDPVGSFYGFKYQGVYQNSEDTYLKDANGNVVTNIQGNPVVMRNGTEYVYPGDAKYMDVNGDGVIDQYDVVYLGNSNPTLTGGFHFDLRYKGWGLSASFQGRYGQKAVNQTRIDMENMYSKNNQSTAVLARWRVEGDQTDIPRALNDRGYNYLGSDRFVEDASFLRLKTLKLNYTLPREWLSKIGLTRLQVYVTAYDLWTITKYTGQDPEVTTKNGLALDSAKTPKAIRMAAGLNLSF